MARGCDLISTPWLIENIGDRSIVGYDISQ
jgi:hypothetical protein